MNDLTEARATMNELTFLKVARELARDIYPLETILKNFDVSASQWETMQNHPAFKRLLQSEIEAWATAGNTHERVKIKAASLVEEFLPELYLRMHDPREALPAKIEAAKLARDLAGMGKSGVDAGVVGEKFSVTINLGADQQLRIEKDVTPKVIDGEVA